MERVIAGHYKVTGREVINIFRASLRGRAPAEMHVDKAVRGIGSLRGSTSGGWRLSRRGGSGVSVGTWWVGVCLGAQRTCALLRRVGDIGFGRRAMRPVSWYWGRVYSNRPLLAPRGLKEEPVTFRDRNAWDCPALCGRR